MMNDGHEAGFSPVLKSTLLYSSIRMSIMNYDCSSSTLQPYLVQKSEIVTRNGAGLGV